MPSRFEYERAIRSSDLPSLSRLLALTIATWADVRTGIIPDRLQPSLTVLEETTGMVRASVRTHLTKLETGGWLKRDRPSAAAARTKKARTHYRLMVPVAVLPDDLGLFDLGQEMPSSGAGDAPGESELGQEMPQARAADAPELGQELPPSRAGAAPSSSLSSASDEDLGPVDASGAAATPPPGDTDDAPDEVIEGETVDDAEADSTEAPVTAQTIVGEWLERCTERPPSRVIGQVSKEIKVLLDEDRIDADWIRRGIAHWMKRGLHPATLASVVNEVMNATGPTGASTGRQQPTNTLYDQATGTTVFDRARARLAARTAAQEGQGQ